MSTILDHSGCALTMFRAILLLNLPHQPVSNQPPDQLAGPPLVQPRAPNSVRQTACENYLARSFRQQIEYFVSPAHGSGRSSEVAISANGQQVLKRNCVLITTDGIEARFTLGLPAEGRCIVAEDARRLLLDDKILCAKYGK